VTQAYQSIQLKAEQLVRLNPPDELPLAREAMYEYEREQRPVISFVWITAVANYFVKLRFSVDPRLRDELPEARRAVLSILGESVKPYLKPADPAAAEPAKSMNFNLNGSSDDAMEAGLTYLALLAAVAEQSPAQAPVCGGEIAPDFDTELGLIREMSAIHGEAAKSRLSKRIAKIERAGFLEEFVWSERHREVWGTTPPDGLSLAGYAAWRKKNLRRFQLPDFGSVTINHPRPLPVEVVSP
jgi:hypothetical protein